MPAGTTITTNDAEYGAPTVGRQLRLRKAEYDALTKAAPRGTQNEYIIRALRSQLSRDGFLAKNGAAGSRKRASKKR